MRKYALIIAGLLLSIVLGATVFREPVAWAAQSISATIVGPLDRNGNVAVHEQGTANVRVTNTRDSSVPVETIDAAPAERFAFFGDLANTTCGNCDSTTLFTVPQGKIAVIETVSAYFFAKPGRMPLLQLGVEGGGSHYLALENEGTSSNPYYSDQVLAGTYALHLYAGPGAQVSASFYDPTAGGPDANTIQGGVEVSGYYVNA